MKVFLDVSCSWPLVFQQIYSDMELPISVYYYYQFLIFIYHSLYHVISSFGPGHLLILCLV